MDAIVEWLIDLKLKKNIPDFKEQSFIMSICSLYLHFEREIRMRLAILIEDKEKDIIGECLYDAQWVYIMDTKMESMVIIRLPEIDSELKKRHWLSQYLKEQGIVKVGAADFGPKAISLLEEKGISSFKTHRNVEIETQFKLMIK